MNLEKRKENQPETTKTKLTKPNHQSSYPTACHENPNDQIAEVTEKRCSNWDNGKLKKL